MNKPVPASPAQISDELAIKAVYAQAKLLEDGMIYRVIDGARKLSCLGSGTTPAMAWAAARSRLEPVEAAREKSDACGRGLCWQCNVPGCSCKCHAEVDPVEAPKGDKYTLDDAFAAAAYELQRIGEIEPVEAVSTTPIPESDICRDPYCWGDYCNKPHAGPVLKPKVSTTQPIDRECVMCGFLWVTAHRGDEACPRCSKKLPPVDAAAPQPINRCRWCEKPTSAEKFCTPNCEREWQSRKDYADSQAALPQQEEPAKVGDPHYDYHCDRCREVLMRKPAAPIAPLLEQEEPASKNIHGEVLPEKYRFTLEDEARLGSQDFYSHHEGPRNPPTDVIEADRFMAWRWYGQFMSPMNEAALTGHAWRISRERQLAQALTSLAAAQKEIMAITASCRYLYGRLEETKDRAEFAESKLSEVEAALDWCNTEMPKLRTELSEAQQTIEELRGGK